MLCFARYLQGAGHPNHDHAMAIMTSENHEAYDTMRPELMRSLMFTKGVTGQPYLPPPGRKIKVSIPLNLLSMIPGTNNTMSRFCFSRSFPKKQGLCTQTM